MYKTITKRSLVTLVCRGQKCIQMVTYIYPFVIQREICNYSTSCINMSANTSLSDNTSSSSSNHDMHEYLSYQEILQKRRAIRNFDSYRNINSSLLKRILIESQTAPSSFNFQPYKVFKFIHRYIQHLHVCILYYMIAY